MIRKNAGRVLVPFVAAVVVAGCGVATTSRAGATPISGAPRCDVAPANSVWRTPIATLPVATNSAALISAIGSTSPLHPDFGSGLWEGSPIGIPYNTVPHSQAKVSVAFDYAGESDKGPYPIPPNPAIEGGAGATGDRHVLIVDRKTCQDYEMWNAYPVKASTGWTAGSGAVFSLGGNALRPDGWTSADAAGLPILPGLVRPEEVAGGSINHAIRITVPTSARSYLWPARHQAGKVGGVVPMGLRLRLKASVAISSFPASDQVILKALKKYGAIVADNGSPWFISGVPSASWNNDTLHALTNIKGSDFEVVDESCMMVNPNSAQASLAACPKAG